MEGTTLTCLETYSDAKKRTLIQPEEPSAMATSAHQPSQAPSTVALPVTELTPESFAPYGQVIDRQADGVPFGPHDAQLDLRHGIPRYVPFLSRLESFILLLCNSFRLSVLC
jgi:hypothetical protein